MGFKQLMKLVILPVSAGSLLLLTGCPFLNQGLTIHSIYFENQTLSVGAQTRFRIQASTMPGRKIRYTVRAERGRILTGDPTIDQNQQVARTDRDTFTYVAPFTSTYPDSLGNPLRGDTITIIAEDGFTSVQESQTINLSGTTMVFVKEGGQNGPELWAATVDEGGYSVTNHRQLKDRNGQPVYGGSPVISPDGRKIAFVYYTGTTASAIYTLDSSGNTMNITGDAGQNVDPTWAPNSRQLVFASDRNGNNFDLYLVSADREGNQPQRLTNTQPDERYPAFNPSLHPERANTLAVSVKSIDQNPSMTAEAWNLYLFDLSSATYRAKLTQRGDNGQFAVEPKWRPDGIYLAYTRKGPVNNSNSSSAVAQRIYVMNTTQSGEGYLLKNDQMGLDVRESSAVWNPNGTEIAYLQTVGGSTGVVYRQLVNLNSTSSEGLRIWTDFSSPIPALVWHETMNVPTFGKDGIAMDWR